MIPSRLIVLRRYVERELAEADRDQLIEAGIPAYVKRVMADSARSLMVGEENVEAALALLGESDLAGPDQVEQGKPFTDQALQCPRCQSGDIAPLPGYAGLTFAAGVAASVSAFFLGRGDAILPLFGATVLISTVVFMKGPRWRCRTCGLVYGRPGKSDHRQHQMRNHEVHDEYEGREEN
jgi:hypothetical protein